MLSELKNGPKVAGVKQTKRAIGAGRAGGGALPGEGDCRRACPRDEGAGCSLRHCRWERCGGSGSLILTE